MQDGVPVRVLGENVSDSLLMLLSPPARGTCDTGIDPSARLHTFR